MSERNPLKLPQDANPAAITPAVLSAIIRDITPDDIAMGLRQMMDAKLANGQPDVRAIESAIKIYLSWTVGLPVQRQIIEQHKMVTAKPTAAMLANPETRAMLRRLLDDADKGKATDVESE
jgi:hypothetical protein